MDVPQNTYYIYILNDVTVCTLELQTLDILFGGYTMTARINIGKD